jgi:hypothetical protein
MINRVCLIESLAPRIPSQLVITKYGTVRTIDCYVSRTPSFPNGNNVDFSFSLYCPNPYFGSEGNKDISVIGWGAEFKFSSETEGEDEFFIDDINGFEFETRTNSTIINAINSGETDVGFILIFSAQGTVVNPALINATTYETIKMNRTLAAGQSIEISTVPGNKYIHSIDTNGVETNAFADFDSDNVFIMLKCGDNLFRVAADSGIDSLTATIKYKEMFLGL